MQTTQVKIGVDGDGRHFIVMPDDMSEIEKRAVIARFMTICDMNGSPRLITEKELQ